MKTESKNTRTAREQTTAADKAPRKRKRNEALDKRLAELLNIILNGSPSEQEAAMTEMLESNRKLVSYIINEHFSSYKGAYYEDMMQEGLCAICAHCREWDPEKGAFSTFMAFLITDAIKLYICRVHGISGYYAERIKDCQKAVKYLVENGVDNPTYGEIAVKMGVGINSVQKFFSISMGINPVSIDEEGHEGLCNDVNSNPYDIVEQKDELSAINKALKELPVDEELVIRTMFLSNPSGKELSLNETAHKLNMETQDVRRLKNRGLLHLQNSPILHGYGYKQTKARKELEDFANSLKVTFNLSPTEIDANINAAMALNG